MRAALDGRTETVQALLKAGANVNAVDAEGRTALMFAAVNMHCGCANILLAHGADVNARAHDGGTALMLAASSGEIVLVRAMLDRGANISGKFKQTGKTAAMLAREKNFTEIAELLESAPDRGNEKRTDLKPANFTSINEAKP